jgi:hypothetical protein
MIWIKYEFFKWKKFKIKVTNSKKEDKSNENHNLEIKIWAFFGIFNDVLNISGKKLFKNTSCFKSRNQNWLHDYYLGTKNLIKIK